MNQDEKKEREKDLELIKKLLNSNFKATEIERYPMITLDFWVNEFLDKYHNKKKKKVSANTQKKVHKAVLNQLRRMYGPWVTVRIKNSKKWVWDTNLGQVYKTHNGRIYGTPFYDDIFITSHAIERWEERSISEKWKHFDKVHKKRYFVLPSSLDKVLFLIVFPLQVGISNQYPFYRYLNVNGGVFVVEILEGIMIVKTFLKYHMGLPPMTWYEIDLSDWLSDSSRIIDPPGESESKLIKTNDEIPADFCYHFFYDNER